MAKHAYDPGGDDDGELTVEIFRWYGEDKVNLDIRHLGMGPLTAAEARAVAQDMIALADELDAREAPDADRT